MKKDKFMKPAKERKINKKKLIGCLAGILFVLGIFIGLNEYHNRTFDAKLVNSQVTVEEKIIEKDKTIESLTNQLQELKEKQEQLLNKQTELENKNKELEETIEKVRVSKLTKKITASATTSRSSSIARTEKTVNVSIPSNNKWMWANVSAYCSCAKCCGKTTGRTASGTRATAGRTIAASSNYAFGTKIELEGLGTYVVEDRGGAITGNRIDVYFDNHSAALAFGRKNVKMRIL